MAINHATGLRFLHYEDVAVGMWTSGMRLKYITDWEAGVKFEGHCDLTDPELVLIIQVSLAVRITSEAEHLYVA